MSKIALIHIGIFIGFIFFLLSLDSVKISTRTSKVNNYQGIAIFIEAMPVDPWDQLGVVEMETDSAGALMAYNQVLKMLQRTKQLYPSADGFIFSSLNFHSGTAIKFK